VGKEICEELLRFWFLVFCNLLITRVKVGKPKPNLLLLDSSVLPLLFSHSDLFCLSTLHLIRFTCYSRPCPIKGHLIFPLTLQSLCFGSLEHHIQTSFFSQLLASSVLQVTLNLVLLFGVPHTHVFFLINPICL